MSSTYSNLKIELMTTGEKATTWGTITNTNLGTAIEEAITGSADVTFADANLAITLTNTNASQTARNMRLNLVGSTGGVGRNLTVPNIEKLYIVNNTCADTITVKNSTGTTVAVPSGKTMWVFSTGTGVVDVSTYASSFAVGGNLTVGGTGTVTGVLTAPTAAPGTNTTQVATTAFVQAATGTLGTMSTQNANNVNITGGAITGTTVNGNTVGSNSVGARTVSTGSPAGGSDGDIWYKV